MASNLFSTSIVVDSQFGSVEMPDSLPQVRTQMGQSYEDPSVPIGSLNDSYAMSRTGLRVTWKDALTIGPVFQSIAMVSGDLAKIPIQQKRKDRNSRNGRTLPVPPDQYQYVIEEPNPEVNCNKFWRRFWAMGMLFNNAYAWIQRTVDGRPGFLWLLDSRKTYIDRDAGGDLMCHTYIEHLQKHMPVDIADVLHVEGPGIEDTEPPEVVEYARQEFGVAMAQTRHEANFHRRGGRVGGTMELPVDKHGNPRMSLRTEFAESYENIDAAFKTIIARDGMKFHPGQQSFREGQAVERSKQMTRVIGNRFNIAPSRLGEEDSTSYGSKEEDNRDYLERTLAPWICAFEKELGFKLHTREKRRRGLVYEADTRALVRSGWDKLAETVGKLRERMLLTANECREILNFEPVDDPAADELVNPNTTAPSETTEEEPETQQDEVVSVDIQTTQERAEQIRAALQETITRILSSAYRVAQGKSAKALEPWLERTDKYREQMREGCELIAMAAGIEMDAKDISDRVYDQFRRSLAELVESPESSVPEVRLALLESSQDTVSKSTNALLEEEIQWQPQ